MCAFCDSEVDLLERLIFLSVDVGLLLNPSCSGGVVLLWNVDLVLAWICHMLDG